MTRNFRVTTTSELALESDVEVLIFLVAGSAQVGGGLDKKQWRKLEGRFEEVGFSGDWGSSVFLPAEKLFEENMMKAGFVGLVGIGDKGDLPEQLEGFRRGVTTVFQAARKMRVASMGVVLTGAPSSEDYSGALAEALLLARYSFVEHSSKLKRSVENESLAEIRCFVTESDTKPATEAIARAEHIVSGVTLARDLVNQPAGHMMPKDLVVKAREIGKSSADITVKVLNRKQAEQKKMNAFLAVARGSDSDPYVIHMTYKPKRSLKKTKKIVLVGKGITFDSGGLSIKPAPYMEDMKIDMGGAATVLGLFSLLSKLGISAEVHGIIGACENMVSGSAYRPGDVVTAMNGKTIEVINTDAEGRVTLADMLSYAVALKPDEIVDLATLTGACLVGLGETVAGMWGSSDELKNALLTAARVSGEGLETMPMPAEYRPLIESSVADLRNAAASRYGGAITAALFLREFVDDTPWAHIDMAGPAHFGSVTLPYLGKGATGYGVRTLVRYLEGRG